VRRLPASARRGWPRAGHPRPDRARQLRGPPAPARSALMRYSAESSSAMRAAAAPARRARDRDVTCRRVDCACWAAAGRDLRHHRQVGRRPARPV